MNPGNADTVPRMMFGSRIYLPVPRNVSFHPRHANAVPRIDVSPRIYFCVPGNNYEILGK
jgi:hypothetical protein